MGMDVHGETPDDPKGEYFRASVWSWHPIADYCALVAPTLIGKVQFLHSNDGDGLKGDDAAELGRRLQFEIDSGATERYLASQQEERDAIPEEKCDLCDGTGIRTDAVGVENGMPDRITKMPDGTERKGWCNYCQGKGTVRPFGTYYGFELDHLKEFAEFLKHCGGFRIC